MTNDLPLVSVIIPTHNRKEKLIRLIDSILKCGLEAELEIIVVDDASRPPVKDVCDFFSFRLSNLKYIRNEQPMLKSYSVNVGARNAKGKYIFIVDDDNVLHINCIPTLLSYFDKYGDKCCVLAPVTLFEDVDRVKYCSAYYDKISGRATFPYAYQPYENVKDLGIVTAEVTPNAIMVKRGDFLKAGGFDQEHFPIGDEDGEFELRLKKMTNVNICVATRAITYEGISRLATGEGRYRLDKLYPLRVYYLMRSKVKLIVMQGGHRKLTFLLFLPIYYMSYQYRILNAKKHVRKNTIALIEGIVDGLTNKKGYKYR